MPILDYTYLISTYNNTKHYGISDASVVGPSEEEGRLMHVDRPENWRVDIDNKNRNRLEAIDTNKGITANQTDTGGDQLAGEDNTAQGENGTIIKADEDNSQHQ